MTGSEIKTMVETLIDDTLDDTIAYQLINNKINEIESERPWRYLITTNTSLTALSSDTYNTAKALPTDCAEIISLFVGDKQYLPLGLEQKEDYKNIAGYYFINGSNFYLSGKVNETKTITITYRKYSAEITSATSPAFPVRFHKMIPFFVASQYYIMDAGEKNMSWHNELYTIGETLLRQMRLWDAEIAAKEVNTNNKINTNYGVNNNTK